MKREFVRTVTFERNWADCGLNDKNLCDLERILLENPDGGDVIPLVRCRKIAFCIGRTRKIRRRSSDLRGHCCQRANLFVDCLS